jgi:hypothetical protein
MSNKRHEVYFNLHKQCLSVRPMGGKVSHASGVIFTDVQFVVSKAGRERVLREKRKNVHAYVRGTPEFIYDTYMGRSIEYLKDYCETNGLRRVTYNPYKYETFVYADTEEAVLFADAAYVIGRSIYVPA